MRPNFSFGEINVICRDIERSLWFYRDILGFEVAELEDGAYRLRCQGRPVLLLPVADEAGVDRPYCSVPCLSFDLMVDDLEAAYRYFDAHDVGLERAWSPDRRSFLVRDPDGLVIEIIQSADN